MYGWVHDVRLQIVGIQEPKSAQIATRTTSIIQWEKVVHDIHKVLMNLHEQHGRQKKSPARALYMDHI